MEEAGTRYTFGLEDDIRIRRKLSSFTHQYELYLLKIQLVIPFSEYVDWSEIEIVAGAHDFLNKKGTEQTFYAVNARLYEEYYANSIRPYYLNDIAVLTLDREPIINENVKFAPLATSIKWNKEAGLTPTVAGWGSTSNFGGYTPVLNEVNVTIKPIDECAERYKLRNPQDSYICTELSTKDSCTVSLLVRHELDF